MILPSGRSISYARNNNNQVDSIDVEVNNTPQSVLSAITYSADGQITKLPFANGFTQVREYDLGGRLDNIRMPAIQLFPPVLTQQPSDTAVFEGSTTSFIVVVADSVLTQYQWHC